MENQINYRERNLRSDAFLIFWIVLVFYFVFFLSAGLWLEFHLQVQTIQPMDIEMIPLTPKS